MNWIHDTLADFGRRLGITDLGLGQHGAAQLQLQSGTLIAIEPVQRHGQEEVLVYVGRPVGHQAGRWLRAGLERLHFRHGGPFALQVAVRGQGPDALLLCLARVPAREFTPQMLDRCVDVLVQWHDGLAAGPRN